mmetsp:Transcript_18071/g.59004  ORF Transcript_18071/g.59004 Transcript_18071/m.59004 type:complete len:441 (-) Transcript_18071:52-1374(-)
MRSTILLGIVATAQASNSDVVEALPGLDIPVSQCWKSYTGYLDVEAGTKALFHWYHEAVDDAASKPLVLWLNGGPGCSSLGGMFTELGPYVLDAAGAVTLNPYSWNTVANVLFIEQPAGVGFSTGAMDYYDDGMVARDNANFVARWRQRFPDFAGRTLYLTSESYGGHYLPTLALELVKRGTPNFGGFAVGNPLTWMPYRDYGQWGTWAAHQLLPLPLWESYLENACDVDCPPEDPHCEPNATCVELEDTFSTLVEAADPYALDFPTCLDGARAAGRRERHALLSAVSSAPLKAYEPCASDYGAAYLNDPKVRAAIHVSSNATWGECSDAVSAAYNFTDAARPMMPVYDEIYARAPHLKVLVYSGDDDSICATMGSQKWIWSLGRAVLDEWAPRLLDGQLAGYTVKFEGLTFETIHGAGHMCPATQPARTFDVLRAFLAS